jgi:protocatechuate 3,4-dioxygenase alpha subunit
MIFPTTPSQTVGPYFAIGLPYAGGADVVAEGTPGAFTLRGSVYDGNGGLIPDHLIEVWQPDGEGRFADLHGYGGVSELPGFRGFARVGFEVGDGDYAIRTIKPGRVPDAAGVLQAPHIDMSVFARGTLHRVVTRVYFADEPEANATDPLLVRVPAERRHTLLAQRSNDGYVFDIHLQGEAETVFLAL